MYARNHRDILYVSHIYRLVNTSEKFLGYIFLLYTLQLLCMFSVYNLRMVSFKLFLCCCLSASGSYHHGGVLIEGGFGLSWLGAEGGVTAASHQQGGVCGKHKDTRLICAGSFAAEQVEETASHKSRNECVYTSACTGKL